MKVKAGWLICHRTILFSTLMLGGCVYDEIPPQGDCSTSTLNISLDSKQDATNCIAINGTITLYADGGTTPYSFSLNGGQYQTHSQFENLGAGIYYATVKDERGCVRSLEVNVEADNSTLETKFSATPDSECSTNNGTVTLTPSGGLAPYRYSQDASLFDVNSVFTNLSSGLHTFIIKDAANCQKMVTVFVPRINTNTSFLRDIKPILAGNCTFPACHGAGNGARDWTVLSTVQAHAAKIKLRTGNRSMPAGTGKLTQEQIEKIACWVDDGALDN